MSTTKFYILNSVVYELDTEYNVRAYTLVSNVSTTVFDSNPKVLGIIVEHESTRTGLQGYLYTGGLIGGCSSLVGNNGYAGTATLSNGVLTFEQPQSDNSDNIAFWQQGTLTRVYPDEKQKQESAHSTSTKFLFSSLRK
jgi:hypothetical protein